MIDAVQNLLNKPYGADLIGQSKKFICWKFCRDVYQLLGYPPLKLQYQSGLTRIPASVLYCIVLFHAAGDWHAGVVYPDALHFIHASTKNIFDPTIREYVARKDRLTAWPYKQLIEGYYAP